MSRGNAAASSAPDGHPLFTEEHDLIHSQERRFVEERVKPQGPKREEAGSAPREGLREITNGVCVDLYLVAARTDPKARGSR